MFASKCMVDRFDDSNVLCMLHCLSCRNLGTMLAQSQECCACRSVHVDASGACSAAKLSSQLSVHNNLMSFTREAVLLR